MESSSNTSKMKRKRKIRGYQHGRPFFYLNETDNDETMTNVQSKVIKKNLFDKI